MIVENRQLISWLMLFSLILAWIPIASAQGIDAVNPADHCTLSLAETSVSMPGGDIDEVPANDCHDASECAPYHGCAPLQFSGELAVAPTVARDTILFEDAAMLTRYPPIPEQPPGIQKYSA